jgi:predicted dehydrogenase
MTAQHRQRHIVYSFESERRLKACFIGAGGHAYRNVLPAMRYAPVDVTGICDIDPARAAAYAAQFGIPRSYGSHRTMLETERPDVVFIITAYDPDGRVQAADLALEALNAGFHVWTEKPAAASLAEIEAIGAAAVRAGRQFMVGTKKIFFPTIEKLKEITTDPAFGAPSSIAVRYPQALPPPADRGDLRRMRSVIDHVYHPMAIVNHLMGPVERASHEWEPTNGAAVFNLRFVSGAIGTVHFAAGQSGSGPLERVEVIGKGANAVVENGVRLTYYRTAERPAYGRAASFLQPNETAPLVWEPEFSLGQLYNNSMFLLGYVPEVLHFCDAVLDGRAVTKGTAAEAVEIMRFYEFIATTPPGVTGHINPLA